MSLLDQNDEEKEVSTGSVIGKIILIAVILFVLLFIVFIIIHFVSGSKESAQSAINIVTSNYLFKG